MRGNLTEASLRIIAEAAMVFAEMPQRKTIQMPAMSGVAKRAEIGVMRRYHDQAPSRSQQAMKVFHRPHDTRHVLDHVRAADFSKAAVGKGQGRLIEIRNHIRAARRMRVYANRSRKFVDTAAGVQHAAKCTYLSIILGHSFSVAMTYGIHRREFLALIKLVR